MATPTNFDSLTGFFTIQGSNDYPFSWNPKDRFGFDTAGIDDPEQAVFNYSINDCVDSLENPVTSESIFSPDGGTTQLIAKLMVSTPVLLDEMSFKVDTTNPTWNMVISLLNYIHMNQGSPELTALAIDAEFAGTALIPSTLTLNLNAGNPERVNYISFKVNFKELEADPDDIVDFKIYMHADEFVLNVGIKRHEVYLYEDATGDDLIDKAEWETGIIQKHIEIYRDRRYTKYVPREVDYIEQDVGTGRNFVTTQIFYIYTIVDISGDDTYIRNAIIGYLLAKFGMAFCIMHYPDLFSGSVVNLLPTNNRNIMGALASPIQASLVEATLAARGYNMGSGIDEGDSNANAAEIFWVGNETVDVENLVPMPIIAISTDITSIQRPITSLFGSYAPRKSEFPGYVSEADDVRKPLTFHHLVYLSMLVITGNLDPSTIITTVTNEEADAVEGGIGVPSSAAFTVTKDGNEIVTNVSFNLGGIEYNTLPLL